MRGTCASSCPVAGSRTGKVSPPSASAGRSPCHGCAAICAMTSGFTPEQSAVDDVLSTPALGGAQDRVADFRSAIAVLERRTQRGGLRVLRDRPQQVMDLVHERVLPADDVS